jgi:hypothetical protein
MKQKKDAGKLALWRHPKRRGTGMTFENILTDYT